MNHTAPSCLERPDVIVVGESLMDIVVHADGSIERGAVRVQDKQMLGGWS
jgi:hypothetical protein